MADLIQEEPAAYLQSVGRIFAEFRPLLAGSGNISYGVEVDGRRYFVKTAGTPEDPHTYLDHSARVDLLRNAIRVAESVSHPVLPTLHRVDESPWGPLLFYSWLPGELIGVPSAERDEPSCAFQRFRSLPVSKIEECLDSIFDLHHKLVSENWIAVDFYDGSLIYDFTSGNLSVIDLDNYKQGTFPNEMGRMFGSSRFMAPEEFELGALIDERTNVFVMGRTALIFLSDGTLNPEAFRGHLALFEVAAKACEPRPSRRHQSMKEFYRDWCAARARP